MPGGANDDVSSSGPFDGWDEAIFLGRESAVALAILLQRRDLPVPIVGTDVGPDNQWMLELSWPDFNVCVVTDLDSERDSWLAEQGWQTFRASAGDDLEAIAASLAATLPASVIH